MPSVFKSRKFPRIYDWDILAANTFVSTMTFLELYIISIIWEKIDVKDLFRLYRESQNNP